MLVLQFWAFAMASQADGVNNDFRDGLKIHGLYQKSELQRRKIQNIEVGFIRIL